MDSQHSIECREAKESGGIPMDSDSGYIVRHHKIGNTEIEVRMPAVRDEAAIKRMLAQMYEIEYEAALRRHYEAINQNKDA